MTRHRWTADEIAVLGTLPDGEVAARIDVSRHAVKAARIDRGIPPYRGPAWRWTPDRVALLGTMSDGDLARLLNVTPGSVSQARCTRGIAAFHGGRAHKWTRHEESMLGRAPDDAIGRAIGVAGRVVRHRRITLGIAPFQTSPWTRYHVTHDKIREVLAARGGMTAAQIAAAIGMEHGYVCRVLHDVRGLTLSRMVVNGRRSRVWALRRAA